MCTILPFKLLRQKYSCPELGLPLVQLTCISLYVGYGIMVYMCIIVFEVDIFWLGCYAKLFYKIKCTHRIRLPKSVNYGLNLYILLALLGQHIGLKIPIVRNVWPALCDLNGYKKTQPPCSQHQCPHRK